MNPGLRGGVTPTAGCSEPGLSRAPGQQEDTVPLSLLLGP